MVIALDIGKVAQGERHRISSFVMHAYPVDRRSELAGIGGEQEDHAERNNGSIFEELGGLVQELFPGQVDLADHVHDLMARAVHLHPILGGKEKGDDGVGDDENQDVDDHGANLRKLDLRDPQNDKRKEHHQQDHADIIGIHDRESEQQKTQQFGQPRKPVNGRIYRIV